MRSSRAHYILIKVVKVSESLRTAFGDAARETRGKLVPLHLVPAELLRWLSEQPGAAR